MWIAIAYFAGVATPLLAIWIWGEGAFKPTPPAAIFPCNTCDTEGACKSAGWCREAE